MFHCLFVFTIWNTSLLEYLDDFVKVSWQGVHFYLKCIWLLSTKSVTEVLGVVDWLAVYILNNMEEDMVHLWEHQLGLGPNLKF